MKKNIFAYVLLLLSSVCFAHSHESNYEPAFKNDVLKNVFSFTTGNLKATSDSTYYIFFSLIEDKSNFTHDIWNKAKNTKYKDYKFVWIPVFEPTSDKGVDDYILYDYADLLFSEKPENYLNNWHTSHIETIYKGKVVDEKKEMLRKKQIEKGASDQIIINNIAWYNFNYNSGQIDELKESVYKINQNNTIGLTILN